jgi:hypothetical protein
VDLIQLPGWVRKISIQSATQNSRAHPLAAVWGLVGVCAILVYAVYRLAAFMMVAIAGGLTPIQWAALVSSMLFMAWSEGYRGFQLKFSPRVVARAMYLYQNDSPLWVRGLAPLFCVGYFHATRRVAMVAWLGTAGIIVLVFLVHRIDQPWRGIIDAGVVIGLSWGLISMIWIAVRSFASGQAPCSPELS